MWKAKSMTLYQIIYQFGCYAVINTITNEVLHICDTAMQANAYIQWQSDEYNWS